MPVDLAKVDILRDRMKCTYEDAQAALTATDGDVVSSLAHLEKNQADGANVGDLFTDVVEDVQRLLEAGGKIRRVRVRLGDRTLREFPLEVTAIGAILIGAVAVMASRLAIDVIRD